MPKLRIRHEPNRPSGGERVFSDDEGHGALVFRCISDGRHAARALAMDPLSFRDAVDDALRSWLHAAPRIGILT